ncbi:MAG: mechanosensitive ion channel [Flavobacteriales bacterium]|nr:mechanosensitive ion channel [Flavobacteriales bacterium]
MRTFQLAIVLLYATLAGAATPDSSQRPVHSGPGDVERTFRPSVPEDLYVANRFIITLRSEVLGNTPEQRVAAIHKRLDDALDLNGPCSVSDSAVFSGRAILLDGRPLMYISPLDVDPTLGEDLNATTRNTLASLRTAIGEMREMRDSSAMLNNGLASLLFTALFLIVIWLLGRSRRWLRLEAVRLVKRSMARTGIKGGLTRGHALVIVVQRLAYSIIGLLMVVAFYFWLTAVLDRIPMTRAWSEQMFALLARGGLWMLEKVMDALPGLAVVLVILLITRWITRLIAAFFQRIAKGELEVAWIDPAIALPTRRVAVVLLWLFALVLAFPFIPGSGSKAFQGVGVLAGIMLSLGSSGVVSQAMSGLALMFNRIMRVGELVSVGDLVTGVVKEIGYFNSTITTLQGEEVNVPNGTIMANTVTNLSRHTGGKGVLWCASVTIGYDAPWRQVHALLQEAARRTPGLAADIPPVVTQHALNDFYVHYKLTSIVEGPVRETVSALHANIQDVFNANGVQIMSPHYVQDPERPKVVPKEQWDPGVH